MNDHSHGKDMTGKDVTISTGRVEIDQQMGGGIPWGSLTLVEGKHGTGKSVLCQHLAFSALRSGSSVAYYSSEIASPSLISQMSSMGLDVLDYFLLDKLRVFPLELPAGSPNLSCHLEQLMRHISALPPGFDFIVVDSLTAVLTPLRSQLPPNFWSEPMSSAGRAALWC